MSTRVHPALLALLRPLSWIYTGALRVRNQRLERPGAVRRAGLPVVSVGNLTLGGTGKTPFAAWLARRLIDLGRRPAVVSRGYGGRAGRGPLLVTRGDGPRCDAALCGDEPLLLARLLTGVIIVVGSDRWAGAAAAQREGADTIVLDDGFQHRGLHRDLDIVLVERSDPFGNGRVIPAGILREPLSALGRADAVLVSGRRRDDKFREIEQVVRRHNGSAVVSPVGRRRVGFFDARGVRVGRPARAFAFCGIANPRRFRDDLEREGVEIVGYQAFRDHHPYSGNRLRELVERAERARATPVTTEKDMARLDRERSSAVLSSVTALRIEADPGEPELLLELVRRAVGSERT